MTDYLLFSADRMRDEQHIRLPTSVWTREEIVGLEGVPRLASLECDLPLAEVYDKASLPIR